MPHIVSTGSVTGMATILFTQNLRRHVNLARCEVSADTLAEALDQVFAENPRLRGYLLDDGGAVRRHVAILLNDVSINDRTTLSDPIKTADRIVVLQALSGG